MSVKEENRDIAARLSTLSKMKLSVKRESHMRRLLATDDVEALVSALSQAARSARAKERCLAVELLARVAGRDSGHSRKCRAILLKVSSTETSVSVLDALAFAFGRVRSVRAVPFLVGLSHHPSLQIRQRAAFALGGVDTPSSISALIALSRDEKSGVRDWAVFGLGSLCDRDSSAIRRALAERLNDADAEIRSEAILGLARRKDKRAMKALRRELDRGYYGLPLLEAICEVPDKELLPYLREIAAYVKRDKLLLAVLRLAESTCREVDSH